MNTKKRDIKIKGIKKVIKNYLESMSVGKGFLNDLFITGIAEDILKEIETKSKNTR